MDFDKYQYEASELALPTALNPEYLVAGLAAEAGEVAGVYAKRIRDGLKEDYYDKMKKELGDCLWFIAVLCEIYSWNLGDLAQENLDKLQSRKLRGKLQGSGDDR
jgi:NTP pyrophosphatase (non-canonical NTP hydrolase)